MSPWVRALVEYVVWALTALGVFIVLFVLLLLFGCAGQIGPVGFAFGQASVCRGPADSYYSAVTGMLEAERCEGGYVTGGPVSETTGRALGVVGDAAIRAGSALGGVPAPPRAVCSGEPCE